MKTNILRICDVLGRCGYYLSAILIIFIAVSVVCEVIFRAITGSSIAWVTEISGYLLAGVIFLGIGYVYRHDGHVRMSLLLDILNPQLARLLYWLTDLIVLLYASIQLWKFIELASEAYAFNWRSSTTLEIPLFLPQALMVCGAMVFLLEVVQTALTRQVVMPATSEVEEEAVK